MENLLKKSNTLSSIGSNNTNYSLGCGTRRVRNQEDYIWINLLTGEWIKIPQITDEFLISCTNRNASECIKEYSDRIGSSVNLLEELLEFIIFKGFIEKNSTSNSPIEGVNFINIFSENIPRIEIEEIFKFECINLCIKPNKDVIEKRLTLKQWSEFFNKINNSSVKKATIILWEDSETKDLEYYISLLKECVDSITIDIVIKNFKSIDNIIIQLTEHLCVDKDMVTIRIEADKINSIEELNEYREYIESLVQKSGIKVVYKLGVHLISENKLISYFQNDNEGLKLYSFSSMCCFNEEYNVNENLNINLMLKNWFKLMEQYSLINYKCNVTSSSFNSPKLSCGAGRKTIAIMEDGSVYPCPNMSIEKYRIGSIITDDIYELEKESKKLLLNTSVEKRENCKGCFIAYFCGGGCLARAYNTVDNTDPFCRFFKGGSGLIPWYFDNELSFKQNMRCLSEKVNYGE